MSDFPPYAKLGDTIVRHTSGGRYWRDAGKWTVSTELVEGKILIKKASWHHHWAGTELVPASELEWRESNKGYV